MNRLPLGPGGLLSVLLALVAVAASCSNDASPSSPPPAPDLGCVEPATGLPADLFCTGLYADHSIDRSQARLAAGVMPYTPGVRLWSDGAEKHRFLYLPPSTQIDTSDLDSWKFPVGTKTWKEFRVDGVLVETRMYRKRSATLWDAGTYVWDSTGTKATLNTALKGTILPSGYEIPTLKDCDKCHHGGPDKVLGIEAVALALPTADGATLTALAQQGLLSHPPSPTTIHFPEDDTGKAGVALGYLHANCGMPCHSARGLGDETKLVLRLRAGEFWPDGAAPPATVDASTTDSFQATLNQPPTTAAVAQAFPGSKRITPGSHATSLLWQVSHLRGNYQMPPLVSHKVDDVGTQQLADWIDALPTP
jgi:hypothetical protein